jgi:hypothetical protein
MSWSSAKPLKLVAVLSLFLLAACSGFRPLYGDVGFNPARYAFRYAEPASRLDQIIYAELRLRLGPESNAPGALRVAVSTSAAARALTRTGTPRVASVNAMTVTTSYSVTTPEGDIVTSGARSTEAVYTVVGQVLADTEAANDASERGARALADTVRLAILGALATAK